MTDPLPEAGTARDAPAELPLFRRAPALRRALPWTPLGSYPTPLETREVDGRLLLAKRDDLCAAGYAGNKVRKLEFLLAEAQSRGARRVITAGATGSHHALATAWHARRLGMAASLVLFPQRLTPHVRDVLLMQAGTGAELRWVRRMEALPLALWWARQVHRRGGAIIIPPGGSSATGALGYVNAGLELAEQLHGAAGPRPDRIHVAAGTLGTVAGLAVGLAWAGLQLPIIATRITATVVTNERVLRRLVDATLSRLRAAGAGDVPAADAALRLVQLRHDQIGTGYGHATPAGEHAAAAFAEAGLQLDSTYTAKAAAGLLATRLDDGVPLFWHTLSAVEPSELRDAGAAVLPPPFARYVQGPGTLAG
jgi:1-aminocyclopropane-1-carboxylate deaminase/D-cysteine desulfhydrase-like pyridoxal-dependent ACC family enzyme